MSLNTHASVRKRKCFVTQVVLPFVVRTSGLAGFRRRTCYAVQCGSDGWRGDWSGTRAQSGQVAATLGTNR